MAKKVGGQAVVEGVLMISSKAVIAVRNQKGDIVVEKIGEVKNSFWKKIPFIRGLYNLYYSLYFGIKALTRSAEIAYDEEVKKGEGIVTFMIALAVAVGLFFLLPMFLTGFIQPLKNNEFLFSLVEGGVRIGIFILYVWVISLMKDVRRIFEYHGAEHKTINAYEDGVELNLENIRRYSRIHPRCGTNFLMIFMISAVIIFSVLSVFFEPTLMYRIVSRIVLIPIIASVSYELLKLFSILPKPFMKILTLPGILLQLLTTREPDDSQLQVALRSLESALEGYESDIEIMA